MFFLSESFMLTEKISIIMAVQPILLMEHITPRISFIWLMVQLKEKQ